MLKVLRVAKNLMPCNYYYIHNNTNEKVGLITLVIGT